jgi:two-component system cell cycle sensor histidine kinase/response regulator CckA
VDRFRHAFVDAPIAAVIVSLDEADAGRILESNRELSRITGLAASEIVGMRLEEMAPTDDREEEAGLLTSLYRGEVDSYRRERRFIAAGGRTLWASVHVSVVKDDDGKPVYAIGQVVDVDERRLAEHGLRASEERYRAIVETAVDGVWMLDADDRTSFVNRAMADMLGYELNELLGRHPREFTAESDQLEAALRRRRGGLSERYETTFVRKDGSELVAEISATPLFGDNGHYTGSTGMVVDATERRLAEHAREQLEGRLQQAQRLESVGQLAGGIAHDFNNILAVILNYAYFVRQQLPEGSSVRADVDEIRRAAERASELTRQLLIFSRRDPVQPQVLELDSLVGDMERLLRRTIGENYVLRTSLCEGVCHVRADPPQLEQVVLNLVMNARDAMPGGGTISIETRRADDDDPARPDGLLPGGHVVLSVGDEGMGMEPEVAARAFEPFFTTKPKGAGTGLGLATVYGTITRAGGEAQVDTLPGEGTTVHVWLPAVSPREGPHDEAAEPEELDGSGATILVVEDEEAVRTLTSRILSSSGFECLDAAGADEALKLFDENRERVDLLLTDVVMPGMSGKELAERIGAGPDGVPVLFMSGYTDDAVLNASFPDRGGALLQKPFTADALLRGVRTALTRG